MNSSGPDHRDASSDLYHLRKTIPVFFRKWPTDYREIGPDPGRREMPQGPDR